MQDSHSGHVVAVHPPAEGSPPAPAERSQAAETSHAGRADHPLGPILNRTRVGDSRSTRALAGLALVGVAAVFGIAGGLTPDASGVGTHRQLGFPPCTMVVASGYPCPTCGMTTAFSHAVRGELVRAFHAQPAGLVLALGCGLVAVLAVSTLVTGRGWRVNWYRVRPLWCTVALAVILLLGWGYKIAVMRWL